MSDVEIEPGRIIAGKYRVEAPLAQGGMGSVYRARHLTLDTHLAIKFIGPNISRLKEAKRRFEREAKAAALLQSPHVVQVHDYGLEGDMPYLVMELLDGEDLGERLKRRRRLGLEETVSIVTQVARALRRAAEAGIVHRDLKPSNVFIVRGDDEEHVKVLDFGIAKAPSLRSDDDRTRTGAVLGSPRYMSPEQARGTQLVDPRSDLWSLAVIAYRALTGHLPFQGTEIPDLIVKICTEDAPPPSTVNPMLGPELDAFFARALARNPDDRFQTARELAVAFAAAAGQPAMVTSRKAPATEPEAPIDTGEVSAKDEVRSSPSASRPSAAGAAEPTPGGGGSAVEPTTRPESVRRPAVSTVIHTPVSAPDEPSPHAAGWEPTLLSKNSEPPPKRVAAESVTAPERTPPIPLPPPPLPPVPRRALADSVTVPEPTPSPRIAPPLRASAPRVLIEPVAMPEPTPFPLSPLDVRDATPTPDPTTMLHVARAPEQSDRTLTPGGGSLSVSPRHEPPPRGLPRIVAIVAATLLALGATVVVVTWTRSASEVTRGSASPRPQPAPTSPPEPAPVIPLPSPPEPASVIPSPPSSASAAPAMSGPIAAPPPRRELPPPAPTVSKKRHPILGI